MRNISEFCKERIIPINEVLGAVLVVLCAAAALHFTVKGTRKVVKCVGDFWDWALGEKDVNMSVESLNEGEEKLDKSKVQPMQVDKEDVLVKVIEKTEPKVTKNGGKGFYVFQKLLKEDSNFNKINKAPYYPNYVVFMDAGSKDKPNEKPNFYGMLGFSMKYWKAVAKKGKTEEIKKAASEFKNHISIFAVQTDPQYAKQGLFEVYLEALKKAVKEAKMDGLTIKYEDDKLAETFEKYGFKKIENLKGYMSLSMKEKKDKETAL